MVKVPLLGTMENEIVMPAKRMRNEQEKLPGPVLRTHSFLWSFRALAREGFYNTRFENACSFHPIRLLWWDRISCSPALQLNFAKGKNGALTALLGLVNVKSLNGR